jgi:hypothetical protein
VLDCAGGVEEDELETETVEMLVWRKRSDCAGTSSAKRN